MRTTVTNGPSPYESCVIAIPKGTAGKKLTVTMLVTYKGQGRTSELTHTIR